MVGRLDAASVKHEVKGNRCSRVLNGHICLSEQVHLVHTIVIREQIFYYFSPTGKTFTCLGTEHPHV